MSIFNIDEDLKKFLNSVEPTREKADHLIENADALVTEFREFLAAVKTALAAPKNTDVERP